VSGPAGEPATWAEIFAHLARRYGWTFDQIADMSLDQIQIACEGLADPEEQAKTGKKPRKGIPIHSDEDLAKYIPKKMVPVRSVEELERVLKGDREV
jgi:hypothetical protein